MWEPLVPLLADRLRVITLDLRGFGATRFEPGEPFSHSGDVISLLDRLGVERAAVVGNSFGGYVALETASAFGDRVDRLVLLAPPLPGVDWGERMQAFSAAEDEALERGDIDTAVELNVDMWAGTADRAAVAEMQRRAFELHADGALDAEQDIPLELERIEAPALVAVGSADIEDFMRIGERLERELPDARLVRIDGAGHLIPMERPAEVARLIATHILAAQ
jgi:pimeloyl-ACP methyl ester carboxylesterase